MRTTSHTRKALLALTTGLALTLTACGSNESTSAAPAAAGTTSSQTVDGISTVHNEADTAFLTGMHPHHQGALAMAELAPARAESQEVKDLAMKIAEAQGPEMTRMESMAKAWGVELGAAGGHGGGHGADTAMSGDAATLEKLQGAEFDQQFLTMMIAHHEGALPMARTEVADGSNPQAKALAQEIITMQEAEIAEMKKLLTQL